VFYENQRYPQDVGLVPRELRFTLQKYFHDKLAASGVEVMPEEDAVMKQQREQLAKELAGEEGQAQGQAPQAPVQPSQAASTRVRRSRKTL
jgi:hypothetical protein